MLRIDPGVWILAALYVLIIPADWLLAAFLAAAVHEVCHLTAVGILGGTCRGIAIGCGGAVIDLAPMEPEKELLCALAGPMGSLLLLVLCHVFPQIAICGLVQGLYNLLPVYPLDGGRALRCFLTLLRVSNGDRIEGVIRNGVLTLGFLVLVLLLGPVPGVLILGIPVFKWCARKIPCKRRQIKVQ